MTTYILSGDGQDLIRKNTKKAIPLIALLYIPAAILVFFVSRDDAILVCITAVVLSIAVLIPMLSGMKRQLSIRLLVDDTTVLLERDGITTVSIPRERVKRVVEIKGEGFQIVSADSPDTIFVPLGMQGYDDLKTTLFSWAPAGASTSPRNYIGIIVAMLLIVVTLGFLLKSKLIFLALLGLMAVGQLYRIFGAFLKMIKGRFSWAERLSRYLLILSIFIVAA